MSRPDTESVAPRHVGASTNDSRTSDRVLTAAARVFREKGYAGATTREIAELIGIQKASLYHHISGKEQLLYELCIDSLQHIQKTVALVIAQETTPLDRLRSAIRAHVTAMLEDQDKHATMLTELRALSGQRRASVIALRDGYEGMLGAIVTECQAAGVLRRDCDARLMVLALLNLLNWTIFWYRLDGPVPPIQVAELLETIYLTGVASAPLDQRLTQTGETVG